MALNFLSICNNLVESDAGRARVELDPKRYAGWRHTPIAYLLTEGINQFAVRLARTVIPNVIEHPQRVLPVGIRHLMQHAALPASPYIAEGVATLFGTTARVQIKVYEANALADALDVFSAEVIAAIISGSAFTDITPFHEGSYERKGNETLDDPLFIVEPDRPCNMSFHFIVSSICPLLKEHFPNFPVAPGSLVLALVWEEACRRLGLQVDHLRIEDARFVRPLTPGLAFECTLRTSSSDAQHYNFVIAAENGEVHARGTLNLSSAQCNAVAMMHTGVKTELEQT